MPKTHRHQGTQELSLCLSDSQGLYFAHGDAVFQKHSRPPSQTLSVTFDAAHCLEDEGSETLSW